MMVICGSPPRWSVMPDRRPRRPSLIFCGCTWFTPGDFTHVISGDVAARDQARGVGNAVDPAPVQVLIQSYARIRASRPLRREFDSLAVVDGISDR
jgi:hypothetical protein